MDTLFRPFHTLSEADLYALSHLSTVAFEPLLRPFRELRIDREFSFRETVRQGLRKGVLLPAYERVKIPTRASSLVIALSLNGIDRCSGVALIPLLTRLHELLDFHLYIYTTDLVEAKIQDNSFANDCQLDWNHVYAPYVFSKLAKRMERWKGNKPELLIIDSCGGHGSTWYTNWSFAYEEGSMREYNQLVREWAELRARINGDYDVIRSEADVQQKRRITNLIKKNCSRFVETPALGYFLLRWLFNPSMQERTFRTDIHHGPTELQEAFTSLKRSCRHIHWMIPGAASYEANHTINNLQVDYKHEVDNIRGFGHMLANICHGRCTHKLTKPLMSYGFWQAKQDQDGDEDIPLVLGDFATIKEQEVPSDDQDSAEQEPSDEPAGDAQGDEKPEDLVLVRSRKKGQWWASPPYDTTPELTHRFACRRQHGEVDYQHTPYRSISPVFCKNYTFTESVRNAYRGFLNDIPLDDLGNANLGPLSKQQIVDDIFREVRSHALDIYCDSYGELSIRFRSIFDWQQKEAQPQTLLPATTALRLLLTSKEGCTAKMFKSTRSHFQDCLQMFWGGYSDHFYKIPLFQLGWEERAEYMHSAMALTFAPSGDFRTSIFHELGHYVDHVCPPIAVCCYQYFMDRIEPTGWQHQRSVGDGEHAYVNPNRPWIEDYAGKHYPAFNKQLPKHTEVLSMHLQYFAYHRSLYRLITLDRCAFFFTLFVLMGGPIKLMNALTKFKEAKAFKTLHNRSHSYRSYSYSRRGRRGKTVKSYGFGL